MKYIDCLKILFVLIGTSVCLDNGLALTPVMGWSTWCTDNGLIPCMNDFCDEKEIMDVALTMSKNGLLALGYNYVNLDDCWAGPRNEKGEITAEKDRFPSGTLKPLADYVHSLGMKLGLYTDVGPKTCKGDRPGSWGHFDQDAATFAEWGLDLVKMDWCSHPHEYTAKELYTMMRDALNKTGRPIVFSACEWGLQDVWEWGMDTTNLWRVGPDHLPLWWTPPTNQDPGQGQGTANIIEHFAGLSQYAGPGGWNDPDFLMPGYPWMSESDQITEFSFFSLFKGPLIVATDVRKLNDKQVILNKEVIAINQDKLGIPGDRREKKDDGSEIWSAMLADNTWAVILYNSNIFTGSVNATLNFNNIHMPNWPKSKTSAQIRDLWQHKDLGTFSDTYTPPPLAPHQSVTLKVSPI